MVVRPAVPVVKLATPDPTFDEIKVGELFDYVDDKGNIFLKVSETHAYRFLDSHFTKRDTFTGSYAAKVRRRAGHVQMED